MELRGKLQEAVVEVVVRLQVVEEVVVFDGLGRRTRKCCRGTDVGLLIRAQVLPTMCTRSRNREVGVFLNNNL